VRLSHCCLLTPFQGALAFPLSRCGRNAKKKLSRDTQRAEHENLYRDTQRAEHGNQYRVWRRRASCLVLSFFLVFFFWNCRPEGRGRYRHEGMAVVMPVACGAVYYTPAGRTFPAGERGSAAGSLLSPHCPNYTWACVLCRPSPEFPCARRASPRLVDPGGLSCLILYQGGP
jgi:hypothetical protein